MRQSRVSHTDNRPSLRGMWRWSPARVWRTLPQLRWHNHTMSRSLRRWIADVLILLLLCNAAVPLMASAAAGLQGKPVAEICDIYGVALPSQIAAGNRDGGLKPQGSADPHHGHHGSTVGPLHLTHRQVEVVLTNNEAASTTPNRKVTPNNAPRNERRIGRAFGCRDSQRRLEGLPNRSSSLSQNFL